MKRRSSEAAWSLQDFIFFNSLTLKIDLMCKVADSPVSGMWHTLLLLTSHKVKTSLKASPFERKHIISLFFFNKRHVRSSDLFHILALLQHSSINVRKNAFDMFDVPRGMTDCKRLLIRFTSEAQSWFVKSVKRCWSCVFCFQPFRFIKSLQRIHSYVSKAGE